MMIDGRVILISGGSGRIGSGIAKSVLALGGKVAIVDVVPPATPELQDGLESGNAVFIEANATQKNELEDALTASVAHFGKIDGAVHAAYPRSEQWGRKFEDLELDGLGQDLEMQLGGAIIFSQCVLKLFASQGYGNLVHVSSIQGIAAPKFDHYAGTEMVSPIEYSAIKAGVINITRYLAKYYANSGIRVNCVSPGGILDGQNDIFLEKYRSSCSSKGMLDPSDVAEPVVFLLSSASDMINGQNLVIDDGWSL